MPKPRTETAWPFGRVSELSLSTGLSADYYNKELRPKLREKIYWFRLPGSSRILWNINLVRDWLVNGDCPGHQRAIEAYLKSLPSSSQ
jgi:hypothetical protein